MMRSAPARLLGGLLLFAATACTAALRSSTTHSASSANSAGSHEPSTHEDRFGPFTAQERLRIAQVDPWVEQASERYGLDGDLLRGVIWVESRYQVRAKSPAGARGLMQLMPQTASSLAQRLGDRRPNPYDPEFNITAGALYLRQLMAKYGGQVELALAAYNAGPGNVDKWRAEGGLPPRSREYVALVLSAKARFSQVDGDGDNADAVRDTPPETRTGIIDPADRTRAPSAVVAADAPDHKAPRRDETRPTDGFAPVRYDLDRVDSEYTPIIEPEPPLADTPYPAATAPSADGHSRAPKNDDDVPVGPGILPSLADGRLAP